MVGVAHQLGTVTVLAVVVVVATSIVAKAFVNSSRNGLVAFQTEAWHGYKFWALLIYTIQIKTQSLSIINKEIPDNKRLQSIVKEKQPTIAEKGR
jgi:hypothetical protein